ncbi:MAG: hypothetical protein KC464_12145, partial [Myxococcales bacterium]|nr:hypothetical protein [Myxococcales bacterium]
ICPVVADAAPPPPRVCDVRDFGAAGDGVTLDTAAIQAAIDACATTGGVVALRDGVFLAGTIVLASDLTLDIAPSATLRGSQRTADYPDVAPPFTNTQLGNCRKALVYAEGAARVTIQGGGTLDGNARGVPDWNGNRIKEALRPMAIFVTASTDVTIADLTVKDAATWAVVTMESSRQHLHDLTITTDLGPTHDGIDIVDGHDVLIEDVTVASGDDSICLKSGSATGTEDVVVRRSHTTQSGVANGVKFGTASVGAFRRILVEDVVIEHAQAAAMAVESVDGAAIHDVTFRRITTHDVGTPFFVLLGSRDRDPTRVGSIDGVAFEDITGDAMRYAWGSIVTGTKIGDQTFGISNISFTDIDLTFKGAGASPNPTPFTDDNFPEYQGPVPGQPGTYYNQYPDAKFITGVGGREDTSYKGPGYGLFLRHATGVSFTTCRMAVDGPDPRPWHDTKDTAAVTGACAP